uniref:Reverse transcriptase domain-containing protein n=1 Tax=Tanacetum cinerariifolium TaxID=118510 RepID=A0A6L2KMZ1_TANCI|nr:reverse transcriptase domain-containing protein [Tanacetum cinerariifolium]
MTDNHTMTELLRAPTEGYAEAIVVPSILAEQFELKHSLINMMSTDQFFGLEKDNLHDHIRWGSPPVTPLFVKKTLCHNLGVSSKHKGRYITALKEQINKLKSKAVLTDAISLNPIDPALLQVDVASLVPKLHKNRTAHTDYIRHTQEEAATLREIVESERLLSPLNTSLAYACC